MMTTEKTSLAFATQQIAIGTVLVAASGRGIAAILLGESPAELGRDLRSAFPDAELTEDHDAVADALHAVAHWLRNPADRLDLRLDLQGSPQELAIWEALRTIPSGETRSYGAVARSLAGSITAQEVGAVCAANRVALAIPCHRVVKADGGISGYRWGVRRKRRLLALERAA